MSSRWRLLVDGERRGAENMARDLAVLEAVGAGDSPPTVRLYRWRPPCLSLGRHQPEGTVDLGFCAREGIDVVRRPTGGRAVLHHLEQTYSVIVPRHGSELSGRLEERYRTVCAALVEASRALGVSARTTPGEVNIGLPRPDSAVPCFKAPAGGEVVVSGRKLIGSAMRATPEAVLQHGSILLGWDGRLQAGALGLADDSGLTPHVTTFAAELGEAPVLELLQRELIGAFESAFGVRLASGEASPREEARAAELAPTVALASV